jgi:hypothetical protein
MNISAVISKPCRVFSSCERETPKGAVFIGQKSKWWPRQNNTGGTPAYARETYRQSLAASRKWRERIELRKELRGKDIASACPQGQASFVDVLIEIANSDETA